MFDEGFKEKISLKIASAAAREDGDSASNELAAQLSNANLKALSSNLPEQFVVLSVIGQGGMGTVFKCRNKYTDRTVAIKMLHGKCDSLSEKRFQQEAKAAGALVHQNAVLVHDFGITSAGNPYLVMEHLEGQSLSSVIEENGAIEEDFVAQIFVDACAAIEVAHNIGVIHRDIKPSNLMLVNTKDNRLAVKVLDFGIAKMITEDPNQALTKTGELFGSPFYMSPEQCKGDNTDFRSDVYSLGVSMYECLVGTVPHIGTNAMQTMFKRATEDPPPFVQVRPDLRISPRLESIVIKALERDCELRYQTVSDLKNDLLQFLNKTGEGAVFNPSARETVQHSPKESKPAATFKEQASLARTERRFTWGRKSVLMSVLALGTVIGISALTAYLNRPNPKQIAATIHVYVNKAENELKEKDYDEAIRDFDSAIVLAKKNKVGNKKDLVEYYQRLALAHEKNNDRQSAEQALESAAALAEDEHDTRSLIVTNLALGDIHNRVGEFTQALKPFLRAKELCLDKPDFRNYLFYTYHQLGNAYFALKNWDELEKVSRAQLDMEKVLNDPGQKYYFACDNLWIGYCYLQKRDFRAAIKPFNKAIQVFAALPENDVNKQLLTMSRVGLKQAEAGDSPGQ